MYVSVMVILMTKMVIASSAAVKITTSHLGISENNLPKLGHHHPVNANVLCGKHWKEIDHYGIRETPTICKYHTGINQVNHFNLLFFHVFHLSSRATCQVNNEAN